MCINRAEIQGNTNKKISICMTCKHHLACSLATYQDHDVFTCNEYEIDDSLSFNDEVKKYLTGMEKEDLSKSTLKGLCVNCEKKDRCTLASKEHGTWFCKEYL